MIDSDELKISELKTDICSVVSEVIIVYIDKNAAYSREIESYSQEIESYSDELAVYSREIESYSQEIESYSRSDIIYIETYRNNSC